MTLSGPAMEESLSEGLHLYHALLFHENETLIGRNFKRSLVKWAFNCLIDCTDRRCI